MTLESRLARIERRQPALPREPQPTPEEIRQRAERYGLLRDDGSLDQQKLDDLLAGKPGRLSTMLDSLPPS